MLFIILSLAAISLLAASRIAYLIWKEDRNVRTRYAGSENFVNLEIDGIDFNVGVEDYQLN